MFKIMRSRLQAMAVFSLLPRDATQSAVMNLCHSRPILSVCPSVRPSVCNAARTCEIKLK